MGETDGYRHDIPFHQLIGLEVTETGDGHAEGHLPLADELCSREGTKLAHGGVITALIDAIGGAALSSVCEGPTPTIDLRTDFLKPGTSDLRAEADVLRRGGAIGVVEMNVRDADGETVARGRGVYKTGGATPESPWLGSEES